MVKQRIWGSTQFRTRGLLLCSIRAKWGHWQWSEGSKLRRFIWVHCLTYLDYSNNNQQRKKPCKLDTKKHRQASTLSHQYCQQQFSAVHHNRRPMRTLSTSTTMNQQKCHFPLASVKDCMVSLVVTWTLWPTMRRLLRTRPEKCAVVVYCLVVRNVTPYTTFVPVKLRTQTVIY